MVNDYFAQNRTLLPMLPFWPARPCSSLHAFGLVALRFLRRQPPSHYSNKSLFPTVDTFIVFSLSTALFGTRRVCKNSIFLGLGIYWTKARKPDRSLSVNLTYFNSTIEKVVMLQVFVDVFVSLTKHV
jgi:hypothetical protein